MRSVTVSPHVHDSMRTDKAMIYVIIALLPALIFGFVAFGIRAVLVVAVSVAACVLTEYLLNKISKEHTIRDFSAILTGVLVGMNMSPLVPLYIPIIASVFAIAVSKWTFGGLGNNWINPALSGRVFVFFSFTSQMSTFSLPFWMKSDAVSSATPLSSIKTMLSSGTVGSSGALLSQSGIPATDFAQKVAEATGISAYTVDAFLGNMAGCIGEVSALLLLAGGIFLIIKKVITWHIPVIYLSSFALLSWVFGGTVSGNGLFGGEILLPLFSGGLMLGAFFMATDWVTTPTSIKGQVVFAAGCGFFTFLIRYFGSLPEGVSLAILLMNIVTPTIDRYIRPKRFGYVKEKKAKEAK